VVDHAYKRKKHFHAIMGTSNSFFTLWIEKFIGFLYNTYVLGHFDRVDARRYWEDKVLVDNSHQFEEYGTILQHLKMPFQFMEAVCVC